jgi:hypothetical protein
MKAVFGYLIPAVLLLVAGFALWTTGRFERRVVNAGKEIVMLRYDAPLLEYDAIERSIRFVRGAPWFAVMNAAVREQRATSRYWLQEYSSLALETDASGEIIEQNPDIVFLAANAAYRSTPLDGSAAEVVPQLERLLEQYALVLERDPDHFDAAYNYELVSRVRDGLTRAPSGKPAAGISAALRPALQTIHGPQGRLPAGVEFNDFKIIVPQRSDERKEQPEAGTGGPKVRKG